MERTAMWEEQRHGEIKKEDVEKKFTILGFGYVV